MPSLLGRVGCLGQTSTALTTLVTVTSGGVTTVQTSTFVEDILSTSFADTNTSAIMTANPGTTSLAVIPVGSDTTSTSTTATWTASTGKASADTPATGTASTGTASTGTAST